MTTPPGAAARGLGLIGLLSSAFVLTSTFAPSLADDVSGVRWVSGVTALLAGCMFLPVWRRLPPRATLVMVPVALGLIAAHNTVGGDDPYRYGVFFLLLFVWVGAHHPRWTSLTAAPLALVAYTVPLLLHHHPDAAWTAVYAVPVFVVVGEVIAARSRDLGRANAEVVRLAHTDPLTGLLDRRAFTTAVERIRATGETGALVAFLDLDGFKPVNDLYGHATGDALLVQVSKRLLSELRSSDTLARIGGDEFVAVLTPAPTPADVSEIATRLVECIARPFRLDARVVRIGVSAGIALHPADGSTVESLLRAADTALYRVKDEGRGDLRFFEASMNAQHHARRQLEHELSGAIARDELRLFYQPIVHAGTGEIETFEALIRWQHPVRGFVSPAEFILLAEQTNLIAAIGQWVIDTACAAAAGWPKPWRVSVNVSPSQFRQSDVPAIAAAALARNGLDANRLVIEITESVFIQDAANAVDVLSRLRAQGIRLALDDFGSGYSSLSYLQQFKFDKIKIDQSFVRRLGQDADAFTIIGAIANLGHNLGLHVTAEGVETAEQLAILKGIGFDQMQGYLFGRPAPTLAVTDFEQARLRAMFQEPATRARA